jgi:chloramphenicol-sensitive protein RarD
VPYLAPWKSFVYFPAVTEVAHDKSASIAHTISPLRGGLAYGLTSYIMWGFIPLYFRAVSHVPPLIVLCHRVCWSVLFMSLIVSFRAEWKAIWPVVHNRRNLVLLSSGALLIAVNWLTFILAISTGHLLQASLGYFINPIFSIALGMLFLRERLHGWQWLAVFVAATAVVNLALRGSGFPWIAVSLAISFGLYGLVRKKVDINSLHGLTIESILLFPIAILALVLLPNEKMTPGTWGLLSLSGICTAVPLLFYGAALRRLSLSTLGFLQYVGPTLQFLVAIWLFHESLDPAKLASFLLCWLGIVIYIADSLLYRRRPQPVADEPE